MWLLPASESREPKQIRDDPVSTGAGAVAQKEIPTVILRVPGRRAGWRRRRRSRTMRRSLLRWAGCGAVQHRLLLLSVAVRVAGENHNRKEQPDENPY